MRDTWLDQHSYPLAKSVTQQCCVTHKDTHLYHLKCSNERWNRGIYPVDISATNEEGTGRPGDKLEELSDERLYSDASELSMLKRPVGRSCPPRKARRARRYLARKLRISENGRPQSDGGEYD